VAVDFAPEMIRVARERFPAVNFVEANCEKVPFDDKSFDAVVSCFGALHFERPDKVFGEALRILKPGGRFTFTIWLPPARKGRHDGSIGKSCLRHRFAPILTHIDETGDHAGHFAFSRVCTMSTAIEAHNQRPASVWSSGGDLYDEISRGISDSIEHCVRRLIPKPGENILDLATGTGWTSRLLARRGAKVTGVDIAGDLIAAAKKRASAEGLAIDYQVGDAESLPFGDGAFDAVISTCGIMFASRPEVAAAELARVCRRGGRIALTTWLSDSNLAKMFQVMKPYMPPPPNPAPPSPFEWGKTERIRQLLGNAFDLKFEKGLSNYREPSGEAAWITFSSGYGPTKALAESLDDKRRGELRRDFIAFHDGFPTELGICVPREYWVTVGVRK
jgi:ubiquinone/menaquinone biosynthesis C-methylase UbiE